MNRISIEIKWGILFSIYTIVWMILEHTVGLHDKHIDKQLIYTNFFALVAVIIFYFAIKEKKNRFYNGNITWKQGFISGIILSIIIALLSPITQYISFNYISPNFFKNIINYVVENKKMTLSNAEIYFSLKNYIMQGIYGSLSMGVLTAAIISIILKNKK